MVSKASQFSLFSFLSAHKAPAFLATLSSLVLAFVGAALGVAIGPAFKVLFSDEAILPLVDLVGSSLATILIRWGYPAEVSVGGVIAFLPMLIVGLGFLRAFLNGIVFYLWELVAESIGRKLRLGLFEKYARTHPGNKMDASVVALDKEISSVLSNDIRIVKEYVVRIYGSIPRELIQVLVLGVALVMLSPALTGLFFVGVLPAGVLLGQLSRKLRRRSREALDVYGSLVEWLQQRLMGIETIKQYGTESIEIASMQVTTEDVVKKFVRAARVKAVSTPVVEAIAVIAFAGVLWVAAVMIHKGVVSASVQISFFSCLGLLAQSAGKLSRYVNVRSESKAALGRYTDLLLITEKSLRPQIFPPHIFQNNENPRLRVRCEDICIQYPGKPSPVISGFSQDFLAGRFYCIKGPSGSGKSTLFKVMLGLLDPKHGDCRYFNFGEGPLLPITYMPQMPRLSPGSIADNVTYPFLAREDPEGVRSALVKASLLSVVEARFESIGDEVDTDASALSGGELQRLGLARVFYHRSPVILIDESTSALDPGTEETVIRSLKEMAQAGSCVIMIAHRESVAEGADEVIELQR